MKSIIATTLFAFLFLFVAKAQQSPGGSSFSFQAHFDTLYHKAAKQFSFNGSNRQDFERWQKAFRPRLKEQIRLTAMEKQLAGYVARAEKRSEEDKGTYILERWHIWTEPTVPLPFILLRPKHTTGKLPLVITPHGHGRNTEAYAGVYTDEADRKHNEEGERDIAVQAVKRGYLAIAPTTRAFGETRSEEGLKKNANSSCDKQLLHDLLVGRTPIGERVWDVSRLIDWALNNLPVNKDNIIITGNSGGGTVSLFAAACDTRIGIAVPASYFCSFEKSIGSIHHCECNYIPGILDLGEMADVAGLIAPRPFCAVNGVSDPIFPIAATRQAFSQLQKIYSAAGVEQNCELFVGAGGHRYYATGAWSFVEKHLK